MRRLFFSKIHLLWLVLALCSSASATGLTTSTHDTNKTQHERHKLKSLQYNYGSYKHEYCFDASGRVECKIRYVWDEKTESWMPHSRYLVEFGTQSNMLTYAKWDPKTKDFQKEVLVKLYDASQYPELIQLPMP